MAPRSSLLINAAVSLVVDPIDLCSVVAVCFIIINGLLVFPPVPVSYCYPARNSCVKCEIDLMVGTRESSDY